MARLVVVGDALLDVDVIGTAERLAPDGVAPVVDEGERSIRPGGAGLAAVLAACAGDRVTLVAPIGSDDDGRALAGAVEAFGVDVVAVPCARTTTKTRIRVGTTTVARIDRTGEPVAEDVALPELAHLLRHADAAVVSDYGMGTAAASAVRRAIRRSVLDLPVVWDPHPRGPEPVTGTVATPNEVEAGLRPGDRSTASACEAASRLRSDWRARAVVLTRSELGTVVAATGEAPLVLGTPAVDAADSCGAGDRFATGLASALADGSPLHVAVGDAMAHAAALVRRGVARHLASPGPAGAADQLDAVGVAEHVRRRGGVVVAAGGCFDLLHAGHVALLERARSMGDALIVCLNSDRSVRSLKGPDRPVVGERDRAAMLRALRCVDGVAVFDDPTPVEVLRLVRPDVFVKGSDYAGAHLPEAAAVAEWGGRVATVPLVPGRSTTRLLQEVRLERSTA